MQFVVRKELLWRAIFSHKANVQGTIVKRYLNNMFRLNKLVSFTNTRAHFTLKISAHQDFNLSSLGK